LSGRQRSTVGRSRRRRNGSRSSRRVRLFSSWDDYYFFDQAPRFVLLVRRLDSQRTSFAPGRSLGSGRVGSGFAVWAHWCCLELRAPPARWPFRRTHRGASAEIHFMHTPMIIQGGMGVAVSSWRLARAVAQAGELGVVSGTALAMVLARRLQQGDPEGNLRRAWAVRTWRSVSCRRILFRGERRLTSPFA
jgi:hypothetical protein